MIDDITAGAGPSAIPTEGEAAAPGTASQFEVEHKANGFSIETNPTAAAPPTEVAAQADLAAAAPDDSKAEALTTPAAADASTASAAPDASTAPAAAPDASTAPAAADASVDSVQAAPPAAQAPTAPQAPSLPSLESYGTPARTFREMGLHEDVLRALQDMGFTAPMPVQSNVFRPMMAGRDLIVQSRTGSGKTAAFGIPFVQGLIDPTKDCRGGRIQGLVLGPTRELALQVATEVGRIAAHRGLQVVPIYGGAPMGRQMESLSAGGQIVSGTPGRVLDHLRRGTLNLSGLRILVLDEADEMLSMGFYEDILEIIKRCPPERQTMLFSATMPDEIENISRRHMREPLKLQLSADYVSVSDITHAYYMVTGMGRPRDLLSVLERERPDSAVIFCNTREETSMIAEFLRGQGLDAEAISSDLAQADRERVMTRSKQKRLKYLVATDIAARGIDISDLSHVINYTFPESAEVYVHRTGRTGRAGKSGVAISLIGPRELGNFYYLKLTYKIRPVERSLPSEDELNTLREGKLVDRLVTELPREVGGQWRSLLKRVQCCDDGERILAGLLERHLAVPRPAQESHATRPQAPPRSFEPRPPRSDDRGREERGRDDRGRDGRRRERFDEEYAESPSRMRQREERLRTTGEEPADQAARAPSADKALAGTERHGEGRGEGHAEPRVEAREGQGAPRPLEGRGEPRREGRGRGEGRGEGRGDGRRPERGESRSRPERGRRRPEPTDAPRRTETRSGAPASGGEVASSGEAAPRAESTDAPQVGSSEIASAQQGAAESGQATGSAPVQEALGTPEATDATAQAGGVAPSETTPALDAADLGTEEEDDDEEEAVGEGEAQTEGAGGPRKRRRRGGRGRRQSVQKTEGGAEPGSPAPSAASASAPSERTADRSSDRAATERPSRAAAQPRVSVPGPNDIIEVKDGREFWEAWVDSRSSVAEPTVRATEPEPRRAEVAGAEPVAPQTTAAQAHDPADEDSEAGDGNEGNIEAEGGESNGDANGDERSRRRRRRRNGETQLTIGPGELRLYLNLGKRDGLDEPQLTALLQGRGLPVYPAEIRSTHCYLSVPEEQAEGVVTALNGQQHNERDLLCERARR